MRWWILERTDISPLMPKHTYKTILAYEDTNTRDESKGRARAGEWNDGSHI